jgi:hypothetical protein
MSRNAVHPGREWAVLVEDSKLRLLRLPAVSLEVMQEHVKGHIELVQREVSIVPKFELDVWGNDEAKLIGMELNVYRYDGEPLHGPLLVLAGDRGGDSHPLTLEECKQVALVKLPEWVNHLVPTLIIAAGDDNGATQGGTS